jgi:hypothetical protein
MDKTRSEDIIESSQGHSYLTRCVAIVSLLHERGIIDELLESGRLLEDEVNQRALLLETNFPGFRSTENREPEPQ